MRSRISLRRASIADADILFLWRNEPAVRAVSRNVAELSRAEHDTWLAAVLSDQSRELYIAEEDGEPVGTVRADRDSIDGSIRLSWTVAPAARERGVGTQMVALLAASILATIRADIRVGNEASVRIAEYCGMKLECEESGVLHYLRPPAGRQS